MNTEWTECGRGGQLKFLKKEHMKLGRSSGSGDVGTVEEDNGGGFLFFFLRQGLTV